MNSLDYATALYSKPRRIICSTDFHIKLHTAMHYKISLYLNSIKIFDSQLRTSHTPFCTIENIKFPICLVVGSVSDNSKKKYYKILIRFS